MWSSGPVLVSRSVGGGVGRSRGRAARPPGARLSAGRPSPRPSSLHGPRRGSGGVQPRGGVAPVLHQGATPSWWTGRSRRNEPTVLGLDLLNAIWFSNPATAAPNQRTEGVSENNDDKVVCQFELLLPPLPQGPPVPVTPWARLTGDAAQLRGGPPSGGQGVRTAALKQYTPPGGFLVTASDAGVGVTSLWIISSSCSSEYIDMKALIGLLLLVFGHGVSSGLHSLHYFYTASSGLSTFPEFVVVGMVDGVQMVHYDSNTQRTVLKQDWMEQVTREDPDYLERETGNYLGAQQTFKASIGIVKQRFNQTGGAHMVQKMYGCEWDDEDDSTDGYNQHGYDGEDFLAWDMKTMTWVAAVPQAFSTKQRWNQNKAQLQYRKYYYTKDCVDWLKKYLNYGKSTLQRTEVRGCPGGETARRSMSRWTPEGGASQPRRDLPEYCYTEYCYTEYCYTEYCYTEYCYTEYCYTEYCYTEYCYTEYCYTEYCYTEYCYTEYCYTEYCYTEYCYTEYCYTEYCYTEYCYTEYCYTEYYYTTNTLYSV
ncbi:unnamed protein product [Boreogadus saida]